MGLGGWFRMGGRLFSANLFTAASSLMADRTHKGTCPIPQCAPACPHPSPDLTGIPGLQGVLPMATFAQPPPKPKSGNPTANTVGDARDFSQRLCNGACCRGNSPGQTVLWDGWVGKLFVRPDFLLSWVKTFGSCQLC